MAQDLSEIRKKALGRAKETIRNSVSSDFMVINAINNIEELDKSINVFSGRIREWYALAYPATEKGISDNERLIITVLESKGHEPEMGAELSENDFKAIHTLAASAQALVQTRNYLQSYLERVMQEHCKNVLALAGATIGARLLREAKSLKRLASLKSSTVQLLGAETALFRHLKTGSRSPKYGYIVNHPLIANALKQSRGKAARALADKISIAARLDYFKGEFLGKHMLDDLTKRFSRG